MEQKANGAQKKKEITSLGGEMSHLLMNLKWATTDYYVNFCPDINVACVRPPISGEGCRGGLYRASCLTYARQDFHYIFHSRESSTKALSSPSLSLSPSLPLSSLSFIRESHQFAEASIVSLMKPRAAHVTEAKTERGEKSKHGTAPPHGDQLKLVPF